MDHTSETQQPLAAEENKQTGGLYKFIILFYFLGTVCFVPHNFYVTGNEYWMYKFRNTEDSFNASDSQKTDLQKNFTAYSGIAGNVGMVLFLFVTIFMRKIVPLQTRIIGGMLCMLLLLVITLIFIFVDTDSWQTGFFVVAVLISGLFSSSASVLLVSVFQMSFKFPPRCMAAQMAGQSVCGVLGALMQIIALAAVSSVKGTASLYYSIATVTVASVLIAYILILYNSEDFKNYLKSKPKSVEGLGRKAPKFEWAVIKSVFRKLWLLITALVFCVGTTGVLHSGVTALIESSGKGTSAWSDKFFLPVTVFLTFNVFEFVGREVSNHISILKNVYVIFATATVRLALLPLILLCNIQPRNHLSVVFDSDAYFIIFMILLSLSSGYVLNAALVVHPELCEKEERITATLIIVLVMIVFVPIFSVLSGVAVNVI